MYILNFNNIQSISINSLASGHSQMGKGRHKDSILLTLKGYPTQEISIMENHCKLKNCTINSIEISLRVNGQSLEVVTFQSENFFYTVSTLINQIKNSGNQTTIMCFDKTFTSVLELMNTNIIIPIMTDEELQCTSSGNFAEVIKQLAHNGVLKSNSSTKTNRLGGNINSLFEGTSNPGAASSSSK